MDILKKINKLRLDRRWSIYRLSTESGISQSTLTNMFSRETLPSITTLECLCSAFGITLSEFFNDNETGINKLSDQELLALYHQIDNVSKDCVIKLMKQLTHK